MTPPDDAPTLVSFESLNFPGLFIRHKDFKAYISTASTAYEKQDATFSLLPGQRLVGDHLQPCISLQAINPTLKGYYLAVIDGAIGLARKSDFSEEQWVQMALFEQMPSLAGDDNGLQCCSFIHNPNKNPKSFIRHSNYRLLMQPGDGTDGFAKDASFIVKEPLWDSVLWQ